MEPQKHRAKGERPCPALGDSTPMLKQFFSSALFLAALAAGFGGSTAVAAPVIGRQPVSQAVVLGSSVTLSVEASDTTGTSLTYQWYFTTNMVPITAGMFALTNAVEAQRSALVLTNFALTNTTVFSVVVSSGGSSVTSSPTTLTLVSVAQSQLRAINATVTETNGTRYFSIPLTFTPLGNDRTVGASFGFNPAVIQNFTFTQNTNIFTNATATVTLATNELASGRFAFVYALPSTTNFLSFQQLGTLSFDAPASQGTIATLAAANLYVLNLPATNIAAPFPPLPAATTRPNGTNLADVTTFPLIVLLSPQVFTASPLTLNRQTGYFQQSADVVNIDSVNGFADVLLNVTGLTNDSRGVPVALATAVGTSGSPAVPFIFLGPLNPNATRRFVLEYYISDGRTNSLGIPGYDAFSTTDSTVATVEGRRSITPSSITNVAGGMLMEFTTLTNFNYYVRYSDSLTNFSAQTTNNSAIKTARPVMRGTGRSVQWLDNGPPRTESVPTNRFYRILEFR